MEINGKKVTSNVFDMDRHYIDENSCHLELNGCIRLVHLSDTEFETIEYYNHSRKGANN